MLFSIVTVSHNAESLIERTIKSVTNQSFKDYEYIIIDGLSSDNTIGIVKTYSKSISYWISERDFGIYNAMNKAVIKCKGEWILFLNAGDTFSDNHVLENISKYCNSDADFICGNRHRVNEKGVKKLELAGPLKEAFYREVVFHQSLFTRRELLTARNYNEAYILAADYEYVLYSIRKNRRFKLVDITVSDFLEGGLSRQNYLLAQIEAIKASLHFIPEDDNIKSNYFLENLVLQNMGFYINRTLQINKLKDPEFRLLFKQENCDINIVAVNGNSSVNNLLEKLNTSLNAINSSTYKNGNGNKYEYKVFRYFRKLLKSKEILSLKPPNIVPSTINRINNIQDLARVTIITVCYNSGDKLISTIESVLNQRYDNLEYIIIDGGSEDNTNKILSFYSDKITNIISEKDEGLYFAMNKGINIATGDYVLFLNAGDCLHDENVVNRIFTDRKNFFDLIYGGRIYKHVNGNSEYQEARDLDTVFYRMPYCHQSLFLKRSLLKKFPFNTTYKFAADYEQSVRLFLAGCSFSNISEPICTFSEGGMSESGIRPYIETIKILFDYCDNKELIKKSLYFSAFTRNITNLLEF